MDRLKQLQLQSQGARALTTPPVVEKLKLSKESQDKIQKIIDDADNNRPQFDFRNASDDGPRSSVRKCRSSAKRR